MSMAKAVMAGGNCASAENLQSGSEPFAPTLPKSYQDVHDDTLDHGVGMFPASLGLPEPVGDDGGDEDIDDEHARQLAM